MRIGFVSDLHIDFNRQYDFTAVLEQLVYDKHLDELVLMGDSANGLQRNLAFYDWLAAALSVPFRTLIGNHDLYVDHPRENQSLKFNKLLAQLMRSWISCRHP